MLVLQKRSVMLQGYGDTRAWHRGALIGRYLTGGGACAVLTLPSAPLLNMSIYILDKNEKSQNEKRIKKSLCIITDP